MKNIDNNALISQRLKKVAIVPDSEHLKICLTLRLKGLFLYIFQILKKDWIKFINNQEG